MKYDLQFLEDYITNLLMATYTMITVHILITFPCTNSDAILILVN